MTTKVRLPECVLQVGRDNRSANRVTWTTLQLLLGLNNPARIALREIATAIAVTATSIGNSTHFTVAERVVITLSVLPPTTINKMKKSAAP